MFEEKGKTIVRMRLKIIIMQCKNLFLTHYRVIVLIWIQSHFHHVFSMQCFFVESKCNKLKSILTLSFLSCRAYGKHGITAVTLSAEAILHALIMIKHSIRLSFTSPQPDCTMYTSSPRTLSPISTLKYDNICKCF